MISPQLGVPQLISSQWFLEIWEKIPELVSLLQEIPLVEKIFFTVNTCSTLKAKMLLLVSARIRDRLGFCRPHRQPLRSGVAAPLHQRLSARAAADDRRTV